MHVDVYLTSAAATEDELKGKTVVVVDVLRASSTIVTALYHGARAVVPAPDMSTVSRMAAAFDRSTGVLGGEKGGVRIDGLDLGNSPSEYTVDAVQGRTVVLKTTNGTAAITRTRGAGRVAVGCFLNASRVVRYLFEAHTDLAIVCVGHENKVALEDLLCAGLLLHQLWGGDEPSAVSDAAHLAFSLYQQDQRHIASTLSHSAHGRRLAKLGFADDVAFCARVDAISLLPIYEDNRLVPAAEEERLVKPRRAPAPAPEDAA